MFLFFKSGKGNLCFSELWKPLRIRVSNSVFTIAIPFLKNPINNFKKGTLL